ncbi:MAG: hypothetical protein HQL32_08955 [Planctomycetes bacterium]|nr:hypothetical protein [Planctomycetota bacterium]
MIALLLLSGCAFNEANTNQVTVSRSRNIVKIPRFKEESPEEQRTNPIRRQNANALQAHNQLDKTLKTQLNAVYQKPAEVWISGMKDEDEKEDIFSLKPRNRSGTVQILLKPSK